MIVASASPNKCAQDKAIFSFWLNHSVMENDKTLLSHALNVKNFKERLSAINNLE